LVKTEPKPIFQPEIYAKTLPKSPIPAFQREILVKTETKSPSQAFQREVLVKVEPKTPSQGGVMVKTEPVQNPCQATVLSHGATNEKPKLEGCLNEEVKYVVFQFIFILAVLQSFLIFRKNPMSCDSDKQIKGETSNPVRVVRKPNIKQSSKPDIQSTLDKIFINNKEGIAGIIGEKWVEPKNIHLYKTKKVLNKNIDCHGVSGSTPPTKSQGNSICNPPKYEKNISVRIEKSKWKMTKDEIENWFLFFGKNTEKLAWIPTKTIPEILLDTSKVEMMLQKHVLDPLPPNLVEVQQETSKSSFPFWQAEDVLKNEKPNWISTIRQVPDCYEGAVTSKMVGRWAAIFDNISFYETNLYQYSQICKTNV